MRPLRLELSAFGSFRERQIVDLRGLRDSQIFLIHGRVGSGKTFLIDGICFALFGLSSGGERDRAGMRNLEALPSEDTVVVLDFELTSGNFRVERRIVLNSSHQSGFDPDEATLWRLPGLGTPNRRDVIASSAVGIEAMLRKLLGLTGEEFCQVAVLPQGQFRRFLLSPKQERLGILSRVFSMERHQRLAELVIEHCQKLSGDREAAWHEREVLVEHYSAYSGDPRASLHAGLEEQAMLKGECQGHREKQVQWEKALEESIRYETLERQRELAERELQELLHPQTELSDQQLSTRLNQAMPDFHRWQELDAEVAELEREQEQAKRQYEELKGGTSFLEAEVEGAQRQEEEKFAIIRSQERLEVLAERFHELTNLRQEVDAAQGRLSDLKKLWTQRAREVRRDREALTALEKELDELRGDEEDVGALRHELDRLEEIQARDVQRSQLLITIAQCVERHERLTAAHEHKRLELVAARAKLQTLEAHDRGESLYQLRPFLMDGKACPLCGSHEHPHPYEGPGGADTEALKQIHAQIEDVGRQLEHTQAEIAAADERRVRFEGRLEELEAGLQKNKRPSESLVEVRRKLKRWEVVRARRERKLSDRDDCRAVLMERQRKLKPIRIQRERLEATLQAAKLVCDSRETRLLGLVKQTFGESTSFEDGAWVVAMAEEQARLAGRLQELDGTAYATERVQWLAETFALNLAENLALERRLQECSEKRSEREEALRHRFRFDFSSWPDLFYALSRETRLLRTSVGQDSVIDGATLAEAIRRQLAQTTELLAQVSKPSLSPDQVRRTLKHERDLLELKVGRLAQLEGALSRSLADIERYDTLIEEIRSLEAESEALVPLSCALQGDNRMGTTYMDWVLKRYFSRVLVAANRLLAVLAPQRFILRLDEGLEVSVLDLQAGTSRSATTLSGGESFLASLALALGLGEVLQGADGVTERLETLFIDEGFGYLDDEAMGLALGCLENLLSEGKTVGLVSHVPLLKERIRAQIEVIGREEGSSGSRVEVSLS